LGLSCEAMLRLAVQNARKTNAQTTSPSIALWFMTERNDPFLGRILKLKCT
jgi:hypothetical protein